MGAAALLLLHGSAAAALGGGGVQPSGEGQPAQIESAEVRTHWDRELRFAIGDGSRRWQIGGLAQLDGTWIQAPSGITDALGPEADADGIAFRNMRLFVDGMPESWLRMRLQLEFADAQVAFRDAFLETPALLPEGRFTLGQFREPFGMDQLTAAADTTFLERNLTDALAPGRSLGLAWSGPAADSRLFLSTGLFHAETTADGSDAVGDGRYAWTGRIAWAVHNVPEVQELLHIGAAASYRSVRGLELEVKRPELSASPEVGAWLSSGPLDDARAMRMASLEVAGTYGALSYQSELLAAEVERSDSDDPRPRGLYAQVVYGLSGESRPYHRGVLQRPIPDSPWWGFGTGTGAWEAALRYSRLDLDLPGVDSTLQSWTVGVNWYANANFAMRANWVVLAGDALDGTAVGWGLRFQWRF